MPDEVEIMEEPTVHECESCGVGQYFHAVKMAGGDWQGIVYEMCLPCKHNKMAKTLGPLMKLINRPIPEVDNWAPKKPIQGVDLKDALEHGLLAGFKPKKD